MKKVYLQFQNRNDLYKFVEYAKNPLCVVDAIQKRILCQLSEEHIEYARKKFKAIVSIAPA